MKTYIEQRDGSLQLDNQNFPVKNYFKGTVVDTAFKTKIDAEVDAGDAEITPFDHTANNLAETERKKIDGAKKYLNETDWYVIRLYERKVDIPQNVMGLRAQAVIDANEV